MLTAETLSLSSETLHCSYTSMQPESSKQHRLCSPRPSDPAASLGHLAKQSYDNDIMLCLQSFGLLSNAQHMFSLQVLNDHTSSLCVYSREAEVHRLRRSSLLQICHQLSHCSSRYCRRLWPAHVWAQQPCYLLAASTTISACTFVFLPCII